MKRFPKTMNSRSKNRRYFQVAGITVCVESDLDFDTINFKDELMAFVVDGPGDDNVMLRHHFELPNLTGKDLGRERYRKPPWAISCKNGTWFYRGILPYGDDRDLHRFATFSADHSHGTIYSPALDREMIIANGWQSLSLFPTDQIWLGPLLADRNAVLMHSAAAIVNGKGLIFIGHSDAGKSTTMEMLKEASRVGQGKNRLENKQGLYVEILCDDRNIIRKWEDGWCVHGTWSHGTTADVSSSCAPLESILFLEQAKENKIVPLNDRKLIWRRLLATLIRSMVTAEWWEKELNVLEQLVCEASFYTMYFDKTGAIVPELGRLTR